MISLPSKWSLVVEAVMTIAMHSTAEPCSSRALAETQGLPPRHLEQLMQRLVRAGILRGIRGPKGGYVLAKDRRRITVADILGAMREDDEAPLKTTNDAAKKVLQPLWSQVQLAMQQPMQEVTLLQLCEQWTKQMNLNANPADKRVDYTI